MSDAKWRWFDAKLGNSNNLALGRFTFADLLMFAFANFGFTIGWKLPEGTDNLHQLKLLLMYYTRPG